MAAVAACDNPWYLHDDHHDAHHAYGRGQDPAALRPGKLRISDVINTYVYRMGMTKADYGLSTAVGLFNSVIGTVLLITTNQITKKLSGTAMF